jgi:hypothetical protein
MFIGNQTRGSGVSSIVVDQSKGNSVTGNMVLTSSSTLESGVKITNATGNLIVGNVFDATGGSFSGGAIQAPAGNTKASNQVN